MNDTSIPNTNRVQVGAAPPAPPAPESTPTTSDAVLPTASQPPANFLARFVDRVEHNDKYTQFFFEFVEPHDMPFLAGQYISVKVNPEGERRSYSISSRPDITHGVELLVDMTPDGAGTQFFRGLVPGSEIEVFGPLGEFVVADNSDETEIIFVASGSGVAPFRAMIHDLLQIKNDQRKITLYWGLRTAQELFWQDDFLDLSKNYQNFHFTPILSEPPDEWTLSRGRVTDILEAKELAPGMAFYLCGGEEMVSDATQILLGKDISFDFVHQEKYY